MGHREFVELAERQIRGQLWVILFHSAGLVLHTHTQRHIFHVSISLSASSSEHRNEALSALPLIYEAFRQPIPSCGMKGPGRAKVDRKGHSSFCCQTSPQVRALHLPERGRCHQGAELGRREHFPQGLV